MHTNKTVLIVLVVLNLIVLLGQLWPEGAPPFAKIVNIMTLILDLVFFFSFLKKNNDYAK
jgi:hypothetical protein